MIRSLSILLLFLASFVSADDGSAKNQPGDNALNTIRAKMISENKKLDALRADNKRLNRKLIELQREIRSSENEVKELERKYPHRVKFKREQSTISSKSTSSLSKAVNDDLIIEEAQELYLSGKTMSLSDEQKLRELFLYDLQYQKQELQLDLSELEVLYTEAEEKRGKELEDLENEIKNNIKKEKLLHSKIAEIKKASRMYPKDIDLMRIENKKLENRLQGLKR